MDIKKLPKVFEKPLRLASIDLGSNSFHLLIGVLENGKLKIIYRQRKVVRLQAGIQNGLVTRKMRNKVLLALEFFRDSLNIYQPDYLRVVGTAAFRQLSPQETLLQEAEVILNTPVQVLTGQEEGRLVYESVVRVLPKETRNSPNCVLDIGGGSTECVIGSGVQVIESISLPLGCLALQSHFFPDKIINEQAFNQLMQYCKKLIENGCGLLKNHQWNDTYITVGMANPIKSIALAIGFEPEITPELIEKISEHCIDVGHIDNLILPGLQEDRKLIFPTAVAILQALVEYLNIQSVKVANTALREGLLFNLLKEIAIKSAA